MKRNMLNTLHIPTVKVPAMLKHFPYISFVYYCFRFRFMLPVV